MIIVDDRRIFPDEFPWAADNPLWEKLSFSWEVREQNGILDGYCDTQGCYGSV